VKVRRDREKRSYGDTNIFLGLLVILITKIVIVFIIILVKIVLIIVLDLLESQCLASEPVDGPRNQLLLDILTELVVQF
jgi:hypothetical protein